MSSSDAPSVPTGPSERRTIVVGIGASAGGLPALKAFLDNMPAGHRLALVLVQHLDPHAESMMAKLLREHSTLHVAVSEDGARVEPDHVYTLPPGKQIRIENGMLRLRERPPGRAGHYPIDAFFASLAEDQEENAIAVILTGSGADGAKGVREIKARGGVVFAQDPKDAEQAGMPESAIATGAVDVVADIASLPGRIIEYASHMAGGRDGVASSAGLSEVLTLLQEQTGMDFSGYKHGTLGRRVHRRMGLRRANSAEAYLRILRAEPDELDHLRKDILIGVTSFFRDPEAFAALEEEMIPRLFEGRDVSDDVRVWVSACSTGEEAYSVAMLLLEGREAAGSSVPIRVFATDANEEAIDVARAGVYSEGSVAAIPMERIARFFDASAAGRHVVSPRLREVVTFATQDLVADPPLPQLDLVCCRNVLIYLTPTVQRALLNRFHFSLKPEGFLFLGRTESVPQDAPFEAISRRWRIFRRSGGVSRAARDLALPPLRPRRTTKPSSSSPRKSPREQNVSELAADWLLQKYAPAAVVIDESHEILSFHGAVDPFLNLPRGGAILDLLAMPKEGLRSAVRTAVYRAARENAPIRVTATLRDGSGGSTPVEVQVEPLKDRDARKQLYIVAFLRVDAPGPPPQGPAGGAATDDEYVRQIEDELKATKADLEETIETSQNHYEELQAANEEVTSMNEELRAANEELMASKEELQALNEEVSNANDELQKKFEALRKTTDDLDNILVSTGMATLFVDRDFRIVRSTPALARLMNVRAGDAGRPLGDITWRFEDPDFLSDAKEVLSSLSPSQKEVRAQDGHRYQRRIIPYRTREDRIEGVLVTFEDIEEKRRAQEAVQAARAYAEGIVATIREPLVVLDTDACVLSANPAFYARFRLEPRKVEGCSLFDLGGGRWDVPDLRHLIERVLPEAREIRNYELTHAFDDGGPRKFLLNGRRLPDGAQAKMLLAIEDAPTGK